MRLTIEEANRLMSRNNGNLDLSGTRVTSLPDGLAVKGSLDLSGTRIESLPAGLTVGRNFYMLDLTGAPLKSLPDGMSVGGSLYLRNAPVESLPAGLTVGRNLDLTGTRVRSLPSGLTVNGHLNLAGTPIASLPGGLAVAGSLGLSRTPIAALPADLAVGACLDLSRTPVAALPDRLTVGSCLCLRNTPIRSLPAGLAVGCDLDLRDALVASLPGDLAVGGRVHGIPAGAEAAIRLRDGDYVPGRYLFADRILVHVRKKKTAGRYTYYLGKIPGRNVVSCGTRYAHCGDFREGIAGLRFKAAKDRGAGQYRDLSLDDELPAEDMIVMYRVITGACRQGTQDFIEQLGGLKEKYTVREVIKLTEGRYGSDAFREFFAA